MNLGSDLTGLFGMAPVPAVEFRQGQIVAFDFAGATNVVSVAGNAMANLPTLNPADAVNYSVGDVVTLMRVGTAWCILGRGQAPGQGAGASLVQIFDPGTSVAMGAITTTLVTKQSLNLTPPSWATHAEVVVGINATALNNTANNDTLELRATSLVLGSSVPLLGGAVAGHVANVGGTTTLRFDFAPGTVLDVSLQAAVGVSGWASNSLNRCYMSGSVAYTAP